MCGAQSGVRRRDRWGLGLLRLVGDGVVADAAGLDGEGHRVEGHRYRPADAQDSVADEERLEGAGSILEAARVAVGEAESELEVAGFASMRRVKGRSGR